MKNPCPTNKIYKTDFIRKNNILWPEGVYCEDKLFTIQALYYANGIVTVPETKYYYFRNPNSTVKNKTIKSEISKNNARESVLCFLREKKVVLRDETFYVTRHKLKLLGVSIVSIKETLFSKKVLLFGIIPIFKFKISV